MVKIPFAEFAALWNRLPLGDKEIAGRLRNYQATGDQLRMRQEEASKESFRR